MSTATLVSGMAVRALGFAAAGYLVVLAAGWILSGIADEGGLGDLAIAALTIAVAAPLGALIGSTLVVAPRRTTVSTGLRSLLVAMAVAVAVTAAGMLLFGNALGITVLLLGATAVVVVWAAFIDLGATG